MALPTIVSVSEDAITAVPHEFREASYAMGATKWQTIKKVVLPSAISGITAAVILGIGRAIGETMVVMMVAGSSPGMPSLIPPEIFEPIMPITATIGIEMGEAAGYHTNALFALGVILFVMVLIINSTANFILAKISEKFHPKKKKKEPRLKIEISNRTKDRIKFTVYGISLLIIFYIISVWVGLLTTILLILIGIGYRFLSKKITAKKSQWIAYSIIVISAFIVLIMLGIILYYIIANGIQFVDWEFLTTYPETEPEKFGMDTRGGIYPAILGTFYLVVGAIIVAVPIGICAGIYLSEYAKEGKITKIIRTGIDTLNATPSIVFGLFALSFLVLFLKFGISLLTGQLILGFLILPTVIRTTEEAVKSIPQEFREGSLALGATKWQTIRKVVVPPAMPGILTGTILSIGRAAGETAPILFTAVTALALGAPGSLNEPVMALPTQLYFLRNEFHGQEALNTAYGTALVLLILVMAFYLFAIILRNHYRKKIKW